MLMAPLVHDRKGEHEKLLAGRAPGGLRAGAGRRRAARPRRGDRARQEVQAQHRRRGRPAGDPPRQGRWRRGARPDAHPHGRLDRDGAAPGGRHAARPSAGRRPEGDRSALQRALRLPRARRQLRGARAAQLQLQLARTAPARSAPGSAAGWRSTRSSCCRTGTSRSATARSFPGGGWPSPTRGSARSSSRSPSITASAPTSRSASCPTRRREILLYGNKGERISVLLPHRPGREPYVQHDVRGRRPEPRAALPRDRLGEHQGRDRALHDHPAVPDLQGHAPQAGGRWRSRSGIGTSSRRRSCR